MTVVRWIMVLMLGGTLVACASSPEPKTLWDRLGGESAVTLVVDDFIANVAADPVINQRFARTDMPKLKRLLVEQIC